MEAKEESLEERQEKMKVRARELRAKREEERQAFVAEKLEQKFREECEDLRTHLSRKRKDELFTEREVQLAEKEEEKANKQVTEAMYADLWEEDRLAKEKREEIEVQEQIRRNREMVEVNILYVFC